MKEKIDHRKYEDKMNKYYTPVEEPAYGKPTGYKYWQYKPWMIKDNWKPLLKNWRKRGTMMKSKVELSKDIWQVVNLMTFWAKEIRSADNIVKGIENNVPLKMKEACAELWLSPISFMYYIGKHADLKEQYQKLKENRREYMREMSENNIEKAIWGKMKKLSEKDVVDYSFRMLERTDTNYNPKQIVETTVEEINVERSSEDIISDISDLLKL